MQKQKIILFDFDGVIVDGIDEYWHSSVLACKGYLLSKELSSNQDYNLDVSEIFSYIRPWVKYGWEMVLITHEIIKNTNPLTNKNKKNFLKNYSNSCQKILEKNSWESTNLQIYLNNARHYQISNDFDKWINLHRPYTDVINFIRKAERSGFKIGIITTKKKIFTSKILEKFNIFPELIYGYESGTKVEILTDLMTKYEIKCFIEDRRKTLIEIVRNPQTKDIKCFLADWGYLKDTDRLELPKKVKLIKLKDLRNLLANSI